MNQKINGRNVSNLTISQATYRHVLRYLHYIDLIYFMNNDSNDVGRYLYKTEKRILNFV